MKATVIIGLPASGKTTLAYEMAMCADNPTMVIDDPALAKERDYLIDILKINRLYGKSVIIVDPVFSTTGALLNLLYAIEELHAFSIDIIAFENNKEQCLINAKNRNSKLSTHKNVDSYIIRMSEKYNLEEIKNLAEDFRAGFKTHPVYKKEEN